MAMARTYNQITKDAQRAKKFFEDKMAFTISPVTLKEKLDESDIQIIDVRKREHYEQNHIPNSISIPGSEIENNLNKLSKDKINIVYCYTQQCHLAAGAALILAENGYPVTELEGGYDAWKNIYEYDVVS